MRIIYKIGIQFYLLLVLLASPFNIKARRWIQGRRKMWKKLKSGIDKSKKLYWFHCSSLGEFEQGRTVIEGFRKKYPDAFLLLTFFSPSGYEMRKNYHGVNLVSYLPLDTRFNAWRFINIVKPSGVFFIKYEFWYYFLRTLKKKRIPVFLVSAKFRQDQVFFRWYGLWYRRFLRFFEFFFVQDEGSKQILKEYGFENAEVSGDTRFDRVYQLLKSGKEYPGIQLFCGNNKVMVAGSTWEKDEEILIKYINESPDDFKFILAPHEISTRKIYNLVSQVDSLVVKFTDEDKSSFPKAKVLLIDTIGHLSSVYKYGQVAYIGGGFGRGIHNILEAATYGLPVIFGPNYHKFKEAEDLVARGAAFSIDDHTGFTEIFNQLFNGNSLLKKASGIAAGYVKERKGATDTVIRKSDQIFQDKMLP
jgi:3-deoxy-D-manno-octulosonic-acid transferase